MLRLAAIATALLLSVPAWAEELKGVALVIGESKYETLTPDHPAMQCLSDCLKLEGFDVIMRVQEFYA